MNDQGMNVGFQHIAKCLVDEPVTLYWGFAAKGSGHDIHPEMTFAISCACMASV